MENLSSAQDLNAFFVWLKKESEKYWGIIELKRNIYGFQIQKGTKWLKGLSKTKIEEYEQVMGFEFPEVYKLFLRHMNGMGKPTINIYAECGEPYRYDAGFYSYPRDLEKVKAKIAWILDAFKITADDIEQRNIPHIMPIFFHRFLVMDRCEMNPVLSMYKDDVILYAASLPQILFFEIFPEGTPDQSEKAEWPLILRYTPINFKVKFWLE